MENILTLEHLAPYLPYGLKVKVEDYKCDYVGREFDEVIGFHQWDKSGLLWSVLTEGGAKPSLNRVKPILRPLSDLTKEIEVDGEKFVPLNKLRLDFDLDFDAEERSFVNMFEILEDYNKLLKWHFDVHGLIPKNLAIDINTLEK